MLRHFLLVLAAGGLQRVPLFGRQAGLALAGDFFQDTVHFLIEVRLKVLPGPVDVQAGLSSEGRLWPAEISRQPGQVPAALIVDEGEGGAGQMGGKRDVLARSPAKRPEHV